eukprot:3496471-Ditylum_brightwellii.AAC.1
MSNLGSTSLHRKEHDAATNRYLDMVSALIALHRIVLCAAKSLTYIAMARFLLNYLNVDSVRHCSL